MNIILMLGLGYYGKNSLTHGIFRPFIDVGPQQQKYTNKATYDNSHPEKSLQVW